MRERLRNPSSRRPVSRSRKQCCRAILSIVAVVAFVPSPASSAAELGVAGDEKIVWVHQTRADPSVDAALLHFAFMRLGDGDGRFHLLRAGETGGEALRTAVRGSSLHVFFEDGTHLRCAPPPARKGVAIRSAARRQNIFWELKLPESCLPVAVAGDSNQDTVYAVVPGRIAGLLEGGPAPPTTTGAVERSTQSIDEEFGGLHIRAAPGNATEPGPPATTQPVRAKFCLVRYQSGGWWRDREIPAFFDEQAGCLLAAALGVCDLYFARSGDEATYFARAEGEDWSDVERVVPAPWSGVLACGIVDGQPVVVANARHRLVLLIREGNAWTEQARIENPTEGGWGLPERAPTACLAGSTVAVAWPLTGGGVCAGAWDLSGAVAVEPAVVEALAPRPEPPLSQETLDAFPYVVLVLALLFVFTRRRQSILRGADLHPRQALASHGRRLLAFGLDALITAPATLSIVSGWLRHVEPDGSFGGNLEAAMAEHYWELYCRWLLALAVYIAYGILFEALRGATPGKMLAGCRVTSEDGGRCSLGAIIVRNVLRCVEFFPRFGFVPMLILVFLTRNRQRLGDLVARSVVVEHRLV